jgi:protein involved in polysaccharide export with SLBB domain
MHELLCESLACRGHFGRRAAKMAVALVALVSITGSTGCLHSLWNSWLDPGSVGNFSTDKTLEIRTSLSIQDSPLGVPGATDPRPEDLIPIKEEYRFAVGDVIGIRIYELIGTGIETPTQATVDELGNIRIPIVGSVPAAGLTPRGLEAELNNRLAQAELIKDAQVIVEPIVRRDATYMVFGATAGPNIYPLPTPNFKLLEALTVSGGLPDSVFDVYVFRDDEDAPEDVDEETIPDTMEMEEEEESEPTSLSSGVASTLAFAKVLGQVEPADGSSSQPAVPPGRSEEEDELIESVVPRLSPATASQPEDRAAASQPAESRFIFVDGKWIEVAPGSPELQEATRRPTTAEQELPEFPDLPEPVVDWDEVAGEQQERIIRVSAAALRDGDPRQNILVRPGDTIRLVAGEVGEYYMMGHVGRPGAYSLSGRRITLKSAIAAAGNLGGLAWPSRCTIYRRMGDREEMVQVNLDRIFSGDSSDFFLKRDDLVVVGTHPGAVFLAVMRNAFRLTYGFGFVYDRNFADFEIAKQQTIGRIRASESATSRFPGLFP